MKSGLQPGTEGWRQGLRELRLKQAARARKALKAANERKPHRSAAQIEAMKERKRERDRARARTARVATHATPKTPDAALTPEQLRKREDNRRYRAATKARKLAAAAGGEAPHQRPSDAPDKQREYQARYAAKKRAAKANGSGHSGAQETSFPLEAIPDRMPAFARERGPSRAHAAPESSVGGVNARLWFAMELLRFVRGE